MAVNCREHRTRNVIRGFKDSYNSHTGLLCFSANWTKSVLGSRYGAKHHGVYLGFNLGGRWAQKARYKDERLLAELGEKVEPTQIDEVLQELCCARSFATGHFVHQSS
jgi:hypothetical protein